MHRRMEGTFSKMKNTGGQIGGRNLSPILDMLIWDRAEEVYTAMPSSELEM